MLLPHGEHRSIRFEHGPTSVVAQSLGLDLRARYRLSRERFHRVDVDGRYLHEWRVDADPA